MKALAFYVALVGCALSWGFTENNTAKWQAKITSDEHGQLIDIISTEELKDPKVEYQVGKWLETMSPIETVEGTLKYRVENYVKLKPKTSIKLRVTGDDGKYRYIRFNVPAYSEIPEVLRLDYVSETQMTQKEIDMLNPRHPQNVAQRQANKMASLMVMSHFGGGGHDTTAGRLYEGIGCGSGGGLPGTCSAPDGRPPIADAWARGANGMIYRCRLYDCGTVRGGGGGGRRGRRR